MAIPPFLKLDERYDVDRLVAELDLAKNSFKSSVPMGHYHDGSWRGISLMSNSGRVDDLEAYYQGDCKATAVLDSCPYFKEIVESFDFPLGVVRLLFLPPGSVVGEHVDSLTWKLGMVRLHIPIVTHEDVEFVIGGEKDFMEPGALWFGDFSQPHSLNNRSQVTRVHMIIDCCINDNLLALFPDDMVAEIKEDIGVSMMANTFEGDAKNLTVVDGYYRTSETPLPLIGRLDMVDNNLRMGLVGVPYTFIYKRIDQNRFQLLSNIITVEFEGNGEEKPYILFENTEAGVSGIRANLFKKLSVLDRLQVSVQWVLAHSLQKTMSVFFFFMQQVRKLVDLK